MMGPVVIAALLALGANPDSAELRTQAESAFSQGVQQAANKPGDARASFAVAATAYEQLRQTGVASASLYRNLGNANLLALDPDDKKGTQLAEAILAYRKGLQLDPTDHELRRSLDYARSQVYYPPPGTFGQPAIDHRPPWLPRIPGTLFALACVCYALGMLALARWWMIRRRAWLSAACGFGVALLLFLTGWAAEVWQMHQETRAPCVVIARDGVQLLVGNGSRYPPRYETPLHRGVEARLRYDRGRWLQIELGAGQIGWVPRDAVLLDSSN